MGQVSGPSLNNKRRNGPMISLKVILSVVAGLNERLPLIVLLLIIIIALGTYVLIDYYVIDLTPGIGTYYNGQLQEIKTSVDLIVNKCTP